MTPATPSFTEGCPIYGALDLGTNTCRLLVAKESQSIAPFDIIDSFSRVIRFGEHVNETGFLTPHAMERAFESLEECARRLRMHHAGHVRCVATAACRKAKNAPAFLQEVFDKTGLKFDVISPAEESALAVSGCLDLMDARFPYGIVFDIGGGSTEVALVKVLGHQKIDILDSISLPYGVLALGDSLCTPFQREAISEIISSEVNDFALRNHLYPFLDQGLVQMIGASGTITTLAAIVLNLYRYDRALVHKMHLYREDLNRVLSYLTSMTREERFAHPCIGPRRADFLMGGVAIFRGIYKILTINSVLVADRGLREGILRILIASNNNESWNCPMNSVYSSAA